MAIPGLRRRGWWWILPALELHLGPDTLVPDLAGWRYPRLAGPVPLIAQSRSEIPRAALTSCRSAASLRKNADGSHPVRFTNHPAWDGWASFVRLP